MSEKLLKNSKFVLFRWCAGIMHNPSKARSLQHLEMDFGSQPRIAQGGGYSFSAASFGENILVQENVAALIVFWILIRLPTPSKLRPVCTLGILMDWAMKARPVFSGYCQVIRR